MSLEVGKWGWYWGPHPETGQKTGFRRCTTIASRLSKKDFSDWHATKVVKGALAKPEKLALAATADNGELYQIARELAEAGGSNEAADKGTALHRLAEARSRGADPVVTPDMAPQLAAYERRMAEKGWAAKVSEFVVACTSLAVPVAGTCDVLLETGHILDIKTGKGVYPDGFMSWEMQVAVYAHAEWRYDEMADQWVPNDGINKKWGVVAHVPFETGERPPFCDFYCLDLERGWRHAQLAASLENTVSDVEKTIRADIKTELVNRDAA